jgi:hypothetical protein
VASRAGRRWPSLLWPEDRAWFLTSEIDFDSTLIGGSIDLVKELFGSADLDCRAISPMDSLRYDADRINVT